MTIRMKQRLNDRREPRAVAHKCLQRTLMRAMPWSGLALMPRLQQPLTLCGTAQSECTTVAHTAFPLQLPHLDDWQWQVMAPCVQQQASVPEAWRV